MRKIVLAIALATASLALSACVASEASAPTASSTAVPNSVIEGEALHAAAHRVSTEFDQIDEISYSDTAEEGGPFFEIWTLDEELASDPDLNATLGLPSDILVTAHLGEGPTVPAI